MEKRASFINSKIVCRCKFSFFTCGLCVDTALIVHYGRVGVKWGACKAGRKECLYNGKGWRLFWSCGMVKISKTQLHLLFLPNTQNCSSVMRKTKKILTWGTCSQYVSTTPQNRLSHQREGWNCTSQGIP